MLSGMVLGTGGMVILWPCQAHEPQSTIDSALQDTSMAEEVVARKLGTMVSDLFGLGSDVCSL